ncbi:MAG TPA: methyltransferase domain-containing protein [Casimicrobiaceae bacterium]|nr:methyltransferase domain-containing protein [Casimicrobiaceae bacterium]
MLDALLTGATRPFLLGTLRYSVEGRQRRIDVRGLRTRYLAQHLFQIPVLGYVLEWVSAIVRLPRTLRFFRGATETHAVRDALSEEAFASRHALLTQRLTDAERKLAEFDRALGDAAINLTMLERGLAALQQLGVDEAAEFRAAHAEFRAANAEFRTAHVELRAADTELRGRHIQFSEQHELLAARMARGADDLRAIDNSLQATRKRLDAIHPPALPDVLAITGEPLAALARERRGIAPDVSLATLSPDARYALFETVFYDSRAVAAKQRIYIDYLDRELGRQAPFVDLGCGRGEFLQILREMRIDSIGVDSNAEVIRRLQAEGFAVVEQDIVAYLESNEQMYSGASMLQVAEHLSPSAIEHVLMLLASRLLPGALLIVETPNPLSSFALGVFHTDPTHISPIPPERMRYSIEAAGFERATTLYQARIPANQFAGPDPRAYYADYAIIAYRTADSRPDTSSRSRNG